MNIIFLYRFLHLKFFSNIPLPQPHLHHPPIPAQFLLLIKSQDFSLDLELGDRLDYNHQEKKLGDPPSQPALLPLPTTTQAFINLHLL